MAEAIKKIQAHNLTLEEMQSLHYKQIQGEQIEVVVAPNGFALAKHEQHLIHAQLQVNGFNPISGEATSKPYVQKFDKKEFEQMQKAQAFAGMKVEVLHDGSLIETPVVATLTSAKTTAQGQTAAEVVDAKVKSGEIVLDDLSKNTVEELKQVLKSLYPTELQGEVHIPTKKAELIEAIEERKAFLDEENQGK